MTTAACDAFREVAPELALGIAVGDERAAALEHLASCPACRRDLDGLTATVDALVQSAPAVEPPAGFERRALAGFDAADEADAPDDRRAPAAAAPSSGATRGDRPPMLAVSRRWLVAASILVVVGAVVAGAVSWRSSHGSPPAETAAAQGVLRLPDGKAVGSVHVERGATASADGASQLIISLDAGAPPGHYAVRCDYEAGDPYAAGELDVGPDGVARWSADVTVPTYDLRRVRLISATGGTNLEAEMPS